MVTIIRCKWQQLATPEKDRENDFKGNDSLCSQLNEKPQDYGNDAPSAD